MIVRVPLSATPKTLGEALKLSLASAIASADGMANPAALLWADSDGQWRELVNRLRAELPELYTYGPYDPDTRTGPAIWLRCVVDGALPEAGPPPASVPVVYLPQVSRQDLRAAGDCPPTLQPLVELQYRGTVWHQKNGRDWTVEAFLTSNDGVGFDVARDARTREAMIRALPVLADTPLDDLRGRRLTAADFDALTVPDAHRDLLLWMHDPETFRGRQTDASWGAFRSLVQSQFDYEPEEGDLGDAARLLLESEGAWGLLWQRFTEAPARYPGVAQLLRQPLPGQASLLIEPARLPSVNEEEEQRLRTALEDAGAMPDHAARERVRALEAEHGKRREWVWAQLGQAPLAGALLHLGRLAEFTASPLGGAAIEGVARAYAADGWRADHAALGALASIAGTSVAVVVAKVVRTLYLPWADASARHFQGLAERDDGLRDVAVPVDAEPETCVLFADGLRFDLGTILQAKLESQGVMTRLAHRVTAVPTVTATAKPLATPIHDLFQGGAGEGDFAPQLQDGGSVTAQRIRDLMAVRGIDVMAGDEVRLPSSAEASGWTEVGRIDSLGHELGAGLAPHLETELDRLAQRVAELLDAGWRRVHVVTDHGWLLLPGGLPKVDLPHYLVASRWVRCASVKEGATPAATTYGWHWNPEVRIATPLGIAAYTAGAEYAHGGLSVQECVVPDLVAERVAATPKARIVKVEWKRLRCVVTTVEGRRSLRVDIRANWKQPASSLLRSPKDVGDDGEVSFPVTDEHEGASAVVVLLDRSGDVLDRASTTVGGE